MDGNKDEALKCLKIVREALEVGDRARAMKFIMKAQRLDPSLEVKDLLSRTGESADSRTPEAVPSTGSRASEKSSVRQRVNSEGSSSAAASTKAYTEEQISIVRQIKRKKDYYEILGLEKSCSVEDVRKAYRKLSLKVHPDKNQSPGAEEAFKLVSKAFQCLSDEESRKRYDLVGSEEVEMPAARRAPQGYNEFYGGAEFDADEIFRNFFFGGMPRQTTQFNGFTFRTGGGPSFRAGDHGSNGFDIRTLVRLLPILLVILLNFLPSSDPVYSLSRTYQYGYRYTTGNGGVPYYVKSGKFERDYPPDSPNRVALEDQVERDYVSVLSQNCRVEMQKYHWGLIHETPHCDMLKEFEAAA